MDYIYDLAFNCDKSAVMGYINCKGNNPIYNKVSLIYDEMLNRAKLLADIKGSFKFIKWEQIKGNSGICEYFVPCLLTLGEGISGEVSRLFKENQCLKAMVLDGIASQVLFNASNEMSILIIKNADENGLNITSKIFPGDKNIPLEFQKNILSVFTHEERIGISLTEILMLNPIKSMVYYYEADKNHIEHNIDCECKECNRMNCIYRSN